jgi:ribonucleoside-triphosphate reductase
MPLPSSYQSFIHVSRYARYRDELGRRETWKETVDRYLNYFKKRSMVWAAEIPWDELRSAIINLEVMPSMRCLMTAGKALDVDQVAGYNCSYITIDQVKSFDEIMYILMCGTGVGFSVESRYTNKLPEVPDELHPTETTVIFKDSRIGWATGFREFMSLLYSGKIPGWDVSRLRPAGARLKTFGGRSSGPEPLVDLLRYTVGLFQKCKGRKFTTIECHDLVCKIADVVVSGGVRRSALISLSDLNDDHLRLAKFGEWWNSGAHRALSNNSAVYEQKPSINIFMKEWISLVESQSGERGIFSRKASQNQAAKYGRRDIELEYGTNPCSEIILRPYQFCNLSEVIVRADDRLDDLNRKIRLATILGTLQSTLSDFRYLNKKWKTNTEEERLLGVSLTGIMDHPVLNGTHFYSSNSLDEGFHKTGFEFDELGLIQDSMREWLNSMRETAVETNREFCKLLGVEQSAAITCVKPSGTVSQLTDTASGIHPRYSAYYIRRVRMDKNDPLATYMIKLGFKAEEDFYKPNNWVFSFPMKAPAGAITRNDRTALEQLELWKIYADNYCEHKPSITIYVGDDEWLDVGAWVYKNMASISGVSFLPRDNGSYRQAPYEEITKEKYEELIEFVPKDIDWTGFKEETDTTENSHTLACTAGVCEL